MVKSVLMNAVKFFCTHRLSFGLEKQLQRINLANYNMEFVSGVVFRLLNGATMREVVGADKSKLVCCAIFTIFRII